MTYLLMALFAGGVVALDQWTKALTVANIPLHSRVPFWDGLFRFTYVRNTGAAFSSFLGQQWLFALIFAAFTLLLVLELKNNKMGFKPFERRHIYFNLATCARVSSSDSSRSRMFITAFTRSGFSSSAAKILWPPPLESSPPRIL